MAETADKEQPSSEKEDIASLTKNIIADDAYRGFSVRKFLTPFKTACLAFLLLILFTFSWALIFGNKLGGMPIAILDVTWLRTQDTKVFEPNFNEQQNTNFPRITASDSSRIVRIPNNMVEQLPETFETNGKLERAPIEEVVEFSKYGKLPKIGVLGEKPSEVYARPAPKFDGRPRIAIMITGLGVHQQATQNAINNLPGEVTLAFSPYGNGLQDWINRARDKGHEIILQMPMEPFDYPDNDPGPSTLLVDADIAMNMSRYKWVLSRITGYIGITNFMGAKFTSKEKAITPILKDLKSRGLYYIENGILNRSKTKQISNEMGLGFSDADVIIDSKQTVEDIENSLEKVENIAATTGMAFAIGSNLPVTIEHLERWTKSLEAKGYQLVPLSAKVKQELKNNNLKK